MASQSTSTNPSGATSMAELMAKMKDDSVIGLKKGDTVKGRLTKVTRQEILMDIAAKGEALVIEKDPRLMRNLLSTVKEGDTVEATVILPESDSGQPVVSLRRFLDNILWKKVEEMKKSGEKIDVTVNEVTKGGYVVSTSTGLNGFLPNSHTNPSQGSLSVNKIVTASIADLDREDNKIIFSQKTTMSVDDFEKIIMSFKAGTKVKGTISSATNFGFFVILHPTGSDKPIDGLIHISELSWSKVDDISGLYKVGEEVEAVVLGMDRDARRVDLSIKRLSSDPFEQIKEQYPVDRKIQGKVSRTDDGNIFIELDKGVEGIIKKDKVPPTMTFEVGSPVTATVSSLDSRRRRIELVPVLKEKPLTYR